VLIDRVDLWGRLQAWAQELGFSQIGVSGVDLGDAEPGLAAWLAQGFHGDMAYMAAHGMKRARPAELLPGTVSVITARMDYLPSPTGVDDRMAPKPDADWQSLEWQRLSNPQDGVVSMYARGRDYHKVLRQRLQQLADRLQDHIGPTGHRVFTDSAPVLEVELAQRSGLGWRGKHTLLLNREGGSMFFLGEVFVDVALNPTPTQSPHCGTCSACIDVCPTQAIIAPYRLDARRCISYLTIEHPGAIDLALRPLMGNRVYGCDDCQLACPWNKYAQVSSVPDFAARSQRRPGVAGSGGSGAAIALAAPRTLGARACAVGLGSNARGLTQCPPQGLFQRNTKTGIFRGSTHAGSRCPAASA